MSIETKIKKDVCARIEDGDRQKVRPGTKGMNADDRNNRIKRRKERRGTKEWESNEGNTVTFSDKLRQSDPQGNKVPEWLRRRD